MRRKSWGCGITLAALLGANAVVAEQCAADIQAKASTAKASELIADLIACVAEQQAEIIALQNNAHERVRSDVSESEKILSEASVALAELNNLTADARFSADATQVLVGRLTEMEIRLEAAATSIDEKIPLIQASVSEAEASLIELEILRAGLGDAAALVGSIRDSEKDIVTAVLENGTIQEALAEATGLPKDSVVAVDSRRGCPIGWSNYEPAAGRMIIGVGRGFIDGIGDQDRPLTNRAWRVSGGEEFVTLTAGQMPIHIHGATHALSGQPLQWNSASPSYPVPVGTIGNDTDLFDWSAGGGQPHNNMPPYIALYFCKKD